MDEQASLLLCNLAGIHGLKRAREILVEEQTAKVQAETVSPRPIPVATPEIEPDPTPEAPAEPPARSPEEQAQRDTEDEGAKNATAAQLREALEARGITFRKTASRSDLLTLWLNRS